MKYSHKNRSGRSSSQKAVTAIIGNNCNNLVVAILGTAFRGAKQNCRLG
jgi:hypothetical protein